MSTKKLVMTLLSTISGNLIDEEPEPSKDILIQKKLFLAGYCVWWFFGKSVTGATSGILKFLQNISDFSVFSKNISGFRSDFVINHLISSFPTSGHNFLNVMHSFTLVSGYAVKY